MSQQAARRIAIQGICRLVAAGRIGDSSGPQAASGMRSFFNAGWGTSVVETRTNSIAWGSMASMGFAAAAACATLVTLAPTATAAAPPQLVTADGFKVSATGAVQIKQQVVFVLGGPGSGKGTQCERLTKEFSDIAHFSAGDLLREHVKSGTPDGNMVAEMIRNGQIVPAEVTVGLLKEAMERSGKSKILIDGFPRNDSNREVFQKVVGYDCSLVLFFDCPEDVLEKRLLSRNHGRVDDNIETIKKRFKVFLEQSLPVIAHYTMLGKVRKIDTNRPVDDIYAEVRGYISNLGR